jgi:hypothetical protein
VLVFIFSSEGRANAEIWTRENLKKIRRRRDKVFLTVFVSSHRKRIFGGQLILLFFTPMHKRRGEKRALLLLGRDVCPFSSVQKKKKKLLRDLKSCGFSNSLSSGRDRRVPSAPPLLSFLLGRILRTEDGMEKELLAFLGVLKRSRRRN